MSGVVTQDARSSSARALRCSRPHGYLGHRCLGVQTTQDLGAQMVDRSDVQVRYRDAQPHKNSGQR